MRRALPISVLLILVFSLFGSSMAVLAADPARATRSIPAGLDDLRLDRPISASGITRPTKLEASLMSATGVRQVVVQLAAPAVAEVAAKGASATAQRAARATVTAQQDRFLRTAGAEVLGRTNAATNSVVLRVDAAKLAALASDPSVLSIRPVIDYHVSLDDTVPYIGATAVHNEDVDGSGVTVAVLDSGIDYTHEAFDGGTADGYTYHYGTNTTSQANKVLNSTWSLIGAQTGIIGGFDFVGEAWPDSSPDGGPLSPDPDPIGCGGKPVGTDEDAPLCDGGHGTHVADIIGGDKGVAPGVEMYAVKVCSAVSSACSGVALLLGMDFALDPNGDGDLSDHADIINMSLGSDYGQAHDDDLALAVDNASALGILTVASSGNASDKPYVTGTPAAAPTALSVAQTAVPTDVLPLLAVSDPEGYGPYAAVFQPWSRPLSETGAISGQLQYGDGAGGALDGCSVGGADPDNGDSPFAEGSLTGLIVMVDRGLCNFSTKIANIAFGGATAGIIAIVNNDAPFTGALGGCPEDLCSAIPGFMISLADADDLRAALDDGDVTVGVDPASGLDLAGTMVGSSSRGPTMLTNIVKPEIGAPGASISAVAGTRNQTSAFGGTSGAAPMVTGSAALLLEAYGDRSPAEIKSLLMNYAETEIYNDAPQSPINAPLAAIARIGAGEVRVDDSYFGANVAAWDTEAESGALSFGFVDATEDTELTRSVTVRNYGDDAVDLGIEPSFRFANDEANGAVAISAPSSIHVDAGSDATFDVTLSIDASALRQWTLDSGANGANALALTDLEYDGYIALTGADGPLHLAWHVLPRQSGDVAASDDTVTIDGEFDGVPAGEIELANSGAGVGAVDGYSLVGVSPQLPANNDAGDGLPIVDLRYAGVQTIPVPAGFCSGSDSFILLLAVNTWERQTHANAPASIEWDLDTDGDGEADYAVFSFDAALDLSNGQNVTFVQNLTTNGLTAYFTTDHGTNSGNTVLLLCGEQIGMNADDFGAPITADVFGVDIYFTGRATDVISDVEFAPLGERYFPFIDGGAGSGDVPAGGSASLVVQDYGAVGTNPSELGVLLLTDGTRSEFKGGAPQEAEAIALSVAQVPPVEPPVVVPFTDISDSQFVNDIVWAWQQGITAGCSPTLYCPNGLVTRGQMATFLSRALHLPATSTDYFSDDSGSVHEANINKIAAAGITAGCGPTTFCPNGLVTRAQMATFLARAYHLPASSTDYFSDDSGSVHEANINRVAAAGITHGCGPTTFCPNGIVTRGQMAAFLHRASD